MLTPRHSHLRAILYALAGFACWVVGDTFMKLAGTSGVPKYEIMSIGGASGMASIFILTALRGELAQLKPHRYRGLAGLSALFLLGYVSFLLALAHMPLADFYAIIFLAPILISCFAALFFGEKLGVKQGLAIVAGFGGVVIAVNPTTLLSANADWVGLGAAFGGMLCVTMQMLTMRKLGQSESRECMAFYPRLGPFIGGLVAMALWGAMPMAAKTLFYCLMIGGIGGLGWVLIAHAYKTATAATIAPFQYAEIVIGAALGYLIWGDVPSAHLLAGVGVIIAAGVYLIRHAHRTSIPQAGMIP